MNTSELTGAALDWAVAKCRGVGVWYDHLPRVLRKAQGNEGEYAPSDDWAQGGPIIEREFIELTTTNRSNAEIWEAIFPGRGEDAVVQYAPTPLIAAMRCYVASKLGDEVEVPDELA